MKKISHDVYGFPYNCGKNAQLKLIHHPALKLFTHGDSLPKIVRFKLIHNVVHVEMYSKTDNKKTTVPAAVFTKANLAAYKKRISMLRRLEGNEYVHSYYTASGTIHDNRLYL